MSGDGEEAAIGRQLEQHLEEQKESLAAVNEALTSDPSNPDLLSVHEDLLLAIKDAEEALLHLNHSRSFKENDTILLRQKSESVISDVEVEPLDTRQVEPEPLELEDYSVGSKCRFRHTDGRWYNGSILGLEGANSARISFLTPTSENMLMCKFFLQQRCRFGTNCRMSHGFIVPISSLKHYNPTIWQQSLVGSSILALSGGVWRKAELGSWDDELGLGRVVFRDDGSSAELRSNALSISEYASETDDDDESSSEEFENAGIGFAELQSGVQTETVLFAKWEHHTRGVASKMMASMGYREGMGLGSSGQGITDPISLKPVRRVLDLGEVPVKKRSRGGKRKRARKFAEAAKADSEPSSDVFSFINNHLAVKSLKSKRESERKEDRRSLVAYDDQVKELRSRVEKLEEMVRRNRKDKAVFDAASRKLEETSRALADAEAAHAEASDSVVCKEKEKKWLKF